jgi:hypothetical protein
LQKVRDDLFLVFGYFPLECLRFVKENRHRLIRRKYRDNKGNGCLFGLLSDQLPAEMQIKSKQDLTRYFTGGSDEAHRQLPEYQAPKWLVRLVDGQAVGRYDGLNEVSWDFVCECLDEAITAREAIEAESAGMEAAALKRLQAREAVVAE